MKSQLTQALLLLALAVGIRLVAIDQGLWLDEAAQALESRLPLSFLWQNLEIDFHPPLYHFLLHFWMMVSESDLWLRLLSVLLGSLTVLGVWLLGGLITPATGLLAAFLLALNPFHLYYSQEIRPYPLAAATYLWATLSLWQWLKTKKWGYLVGWLVLGTMTLYALYPAATWLLGAGSFVWLSRGELSQKQLKLSLFGFGLIGLSFLPWIPKLKVQLHQAQSLRQSLPGWAGAVSPRPIKALPLTAAKFVAGPIRLSRFAWLPYLVAVPVGLVGLSLGWQFKKSSPTTRLWLSFAILPLIFLGGLSFFLPVLEPKRALFALPILLVGVAEGLRKLAGWKPRLAVLTTVILTGSFLTSTGFYAFEPAFQREQWREAVAWTEQRLKPDGLVLFSFSGPFAPWDWYAKRQTKAKGAASTFVVSKKDLETRVRPDLDREQIIYFRYLADLTDPNQKLAAFLRQHGFAVEETVDFPGVGFVDVYLKVNEEG